MKLWQDIKELANSIVGFWVLCLVLLGLFIAFIAWLPELFK